MTANMRVAALAFLLLSVSSTAIVNADDDLAIMIEKTRTHADTFVYGFGFSLAKEGAVACSLSNPNGSYELTEVDGGWYPGQGFWLDNGAMELTALDSVLAEDWVLSWDSGAVIANISFAGFQDSDFHEVPTLTWPRHGYTADFGSPIIWDCASCDAGFSYAELTLTGPGEITDGIAWVVPESFTSWQPPTRLAEGGWTAHLQYVRETRSIAADIEIITGSWDLEDDWWLGLYSIDTSEFTLEDTPVRKLTLGAIKALYR